MPKRGKRNKWNKLIRYLLPAVLILLTARFSFVREKADYPELPVSVDVVVIGSGLAGAVSAFSAVREGADVIYLDLTEPDPGGYPAFSPAFWAAIEKAEENDGEHAYPAETMAADIYAGGGQTGNYALIRRFSQTSAASLSWLENQTGVLFDRPDTTRPGLHMTKNPQDLSLLVPEITRDFDRKLYGYKKGWKPIKILMEGNRVTGLTVLDQNGRSREISARAVLLADGGYASNLAMLRNMAGVAHVQPRREGGHEGVGLRLAMYVGARTNYLSDITLLPVFLPSRQRAKNFNNALFLNTMGVLIPPFEDLTGMIRKENGRVFVLTGGLNFSPGPDFQFAADPGELAIKLNVSPAMLIEALGALQPPYRFAEIGLIALMPGGLVINEKYTVLGQEGPIEGLFAAGEITSGLHGRRALAELVLADEVISPLLAGFEAASWSLR